MLHKMIIRDSAERDKILSGVKFRQIVLKNFAKESIRPSDKLIFCYKTPDDPIGVAEVHVVREVAFQDVTEAYWLQAGFNSIPEALGFYMNLDPGLQLIDLVVILVWGKVTKPEPSGTFQRVPTSKAENSKSCEECDERDQT